MDKYEHRISLQEMDQLIAERRFEEAAGVADTIDWSREKDPDILCKVSDVYKINREYAKSRRVLILANQLDSQNPDIIYSLCELTIFLYGRDGLQTDLIAAYQLNQQYQQMQPGSPKSLVLQYKLYKVTNVSAGEKIEVLERLKSVQYTARWGYELALCYREAGNFPAAVAECQNVIHSFSGKYASKAERLLSDLTEDAGTGTQPTPAEVPNYSPSGEQSAASVMGNRVDAESQPAVSVMGNQAGAASQPSSPVMENQVGAESQPVPYALENIAVSGAQQFSSGAAGDTEPGMQQTSSGLPDEANSTTQQNVSDFAANGGSTMQDGYTDSNIAPTQEQNQAAQSVQPSEGAAADTTSWTTNTGDAALTSQEAPDEAQQTSEEQPSVSTTDQQQERVASDDDKTTGEAQHASFVVSSDADTIQAGVRTADAHTQQPSKEEDGQADEGENNPHLIHSDEDSDGSESSMTINEVMKEWIRIRDNIRKQNDQKRRERLMEDTGSLMAAFDESARHTMLEKIEHDVEQKQREVRQGYRRDELDDGLTEGERRRAQQAGYTQQNGYAQSAGSMQQPDYAQPTGSMQQADYAQPAGSMQQPDYAQPAENMQQPDYVQAERSSSPQDAWTRESSIGATAGVGLHAAQNRDAVDTADFSEEQPAVISASGYAAPDESTETNEELSDQYPQYAPLDQDMTGSRRTRENVSAAQSEESVTAEGTAGDRQLVQGQGEQFNTAPVPYQNAAYRETFFEDNPALTQEQPHYVPLQPYDQTGYGNQTPGHAAYGQLQNAQPSGQGTYAEPQGSQFFYGQLQDPQTTDRSAYAQSQEAQSSAPSVYAQPREAQPSAQSVYAQPQGTQPSDQPVYAQPQGTQPSGQSSYAQPQDTWLSSQPYVPVQGQQGAASDAASTQPASAEDPYGTPAREENPSESGNEYPRRGRTTRRWSAADVRRAMEAQRVSFAAIEEQDRERLERAVQNAGRDDKDASLPEEDQGTWEEEKQVGVQATDDRNDVENREDQEEEEKQKETDDNMDSSTRTPSQDMGSEEASFTDEIAHALRGQEIDDTTTPAADQDWEEVSPERSEAAKEANAADSTGAEAAREPITQETFVPESGIRTPKAEGFLSEAAPSPSAAKEALRGKAATETVAQEEALQSRSTAGKPSQEKVRQDAIATEGALQEETPQGANAVETALQVEAPQSTAATEGAWQEEVPQDTVAAEEALQEEAPQSTAAAEAALPQEAREKEAVTKTSSFKEERQEAAGEIVSPEEASQANKTGTGNRRPTGRASVPANSTAAKPVPGKKQNQPAKQASSVAKTPAPSAKDAQDLSEEEKKLFGPIALVKSNRDQIVLAMDNVSMAGETGNIVITGAPSATRRVARGLLHMIRHADSNFSSRVAEADGKRLNELGAEKITKLLDKIENGAIQITGAGVLSAEVLNALQRELEGRERGIIVLFLDTPRAMNELFKQHKAQLQSFTVRIDIHPLDDKALVAYGMEYALQQDYSIDEMAQLALSTRISSLQTRDHHVSTQEVRDIVDEAIRYASRKSLRTLFAILTRKRYDEDDRIIIREKDFMHY